MQTFLPYPDFAESARVLDNKRLGKQRVECLQILKALNDPTYGWQSHPAVRMWRGHETFMLLYSLTVCELWTQRGFKDTCYEKIYSLPRIHSFIRPPWLGNEQFHASHRSNLLRKDPEYYSQFGWKEPHDLPYVWPV